MKELFNICCSYSFRRIWILLWDFTRRNSLYLPANIWLFILDWCVLWPDDHSCKDYYTYIKISLFWYWSFPFLRLMFKYAFKKKVNLGLPCKWVQVLAGEVTPSCNCFFIPPCPLAFPYTPNQMLMIGWYLAIMQTTGGNTGESSTFSPFFINRQLSKALAFVACLFCPLFSFFGCFLNPILLLAGMLRGGERIISE